MRGHWLLACLVALWHASEAHRHTGNWSTRRNETGGNSTHHAHGHDIFTHLPENGTEFRRLARRFNRTRKEMKRIITEDPGFHVTLQWIGNPAEEPSAFYVCEGAEPMPAAEVEALNSASAAATAEAGWVPADAFALHSRPGANLVIYLDFTGHVVSGTQWNYGSGIATFIAPPYDTDGDNTTFSDTERQNIIAIWRQVAEDYIPWNIDVTTEYVGGNEDFITRSSGSDAFYGTRAVIMGGDSATIRMAICSASGGGCAGVAYLGVFGNVGTWNQPAWVFQDVMYSHNGNIALGVSHEVGHNFNLYHDGFVADGQNLGYMDGHSVTNPTSGPIMGSPYYRTVSQWSKGEYYGANNFEDDLAMISARAPRIVDDHPDAASNVTILRTDPIVSVGGLLNFGGDVDIIAFAANAGTVTVQCFNPGPTYINSADPTNFPAQLELFDCAGTSILRSTSSGVFAALTAVTLPRAGIYFASVSARDIPSTNLSGAIVPRNLDQTGFSQYGSIGAYTLQVTVSNAYTGPLLYLNGTNWTTAYKAQQCLVTTTTTPQPTTTTTTPQPTTTTTTPKPTTTTTTPQPTTTTTTPQPTTTPTTARPTTTTQQPTTTTQQPTTTTPQSTTTTAAPIPPTAAQPTTTPLPAATAAGLSTGAIAGIAAGGAAVVVGGSFLANYLSLFAVAPPVLSARRPFVIFHRLQVERPPAPHYEDYY